MLNNYRNWHFSDLPSRPPDVCFQGKSESAIRLAIVFVGLVFWLVQPLGVEDGAEPMQDRPDFQ